MKNVRLLALASFLPCRLLAADADLKPLQLVPDQVIYHNDFSDGQQLDQNTWRGAQGTQWKVEDGVIRGRPSTPEFQASHKTHKGLEARGALVKCPADYIARFSVRYNGGKPPQPLPGLKNIPSIDVGHHIGRLEFGVEGARLLADGETLQLASAPDFQLEDGRWYEVLVEARGDEVTFQFGKGPTLHGQHPTLKGESLPPESSHTLAFIGKEGGTVEVDNLTLWSVKDGTQPSWPQVFAKLTPESKVIRPKRPGQLAKEKKEAEERAAKK